jgi:hypothetical protein
MPVKLVADTAVRTMAKRPKTKLTAKPLIQQTNLTWIV